MLDAIAAVQRRLPRFLISEPKPSGNWMRTGALYLCRAPKTAAELDGLSKYPWCSDPRWAGVVCFRGTRDSTHLYIPWVTEGGEQCLDYGDFAVFGDRDMVQEVRAILAEKGFQLGRAP
jgi:hypothetical protein